MPDQLAQELEFRLPTCRRGEGFADNLEVEGGLIRGRAVPYGHTIELRDMLRERFDMGAFSRQSKAPHRVKLCLEHGQVVGAMSELEERADGLYFAAKLSDNPAIPDAARFRAMVDEGLADELSVGFQTVAGGTTVETAQDGAATYVHRRARLLEVSLVPWGAYGREATLARSRLMDAGAEMRAHKLAEQRAWLKSYRAAR
jgi:HK97 family phage prohead protease